MAPAGEDTAGMAETRSNVEESRSLAPFLVIWIGQAFSIVGSMVAHFGLIWWVTDLTGSATVLASATLFGSIPTIVLGPIAGAYIDRWDRRITMIVADGIVALASLGLAYFFWAGAMQIWLLIAVVFIRAMAQSFHDPAMTASTTLMVPEKHLTRVAGLNQTMFGALQIFGPLLGALALAKLSLASIMLIDVATALLAIVPLLFAHVPQPKREELETGEGAAKPSILLDVREGLRFVRQRQGLFAVLMVAALLNFTVTPFNTLLPLLIRDHFGGGATELGWLESAVGVGMLVGGITLSVWGGFRKRIYNLLTGILVVGACLLLTSVAPPTMLWLAIAAAGVLGFVLPIVNGSLQALMQSTVPPELQGRVFTMTRTLSMIASPVGTAISGPAADWVGVTPVLITGASLELVVSISTLFNRAVLTIEDSLKAAPAATEGGLG